MSITLAVTQRREFAITKNDADKILDGTEEYNVFVETTIPDDRSDYTTILPLVLTAVDPTTGLAVPQEGEQLGGVTSGLNSFVTQVEPELFDGQNGWYVVTITYKQPDLSEPDVVRLNEAPEDTAVRYSWGHASYTEKIWTDAGGIPIVMSSGEAPTTLPTRERAVLTCTISRRTVAYDPTIAKPLLDTVSDGILTVQGFAFPKGESKLIAWRSNTETALVQEVGEPEVTVNFSDETIILHFKDDWFLRMFDQGLKEFQDSPANAFVPIFINGQIARSPQPLNGAGMRIFADDGTIENSVIPVAIDPGKTPGVEGFNPITPLGADFRVAMLVFEGSAEANFTPIGIL